MTWPQNQAAARGDRQLGEERRAGAPKGRSVFISYRRRLSWTLAQLVHGHLVNHGFDTFMDVENLDSGEFPGAILSQIEARQHFVVLLQPGSLDRIGENGDWLRREIAHALDHGRNVVPVTADGFKFRRRLVLPPDVARLASLNAVVIYPDYVPDAINKLRERFLKVPSSPTDAPPPQTPRRYVSVRSPQDVVDRSSPTAAPPPETSRYVSVRSGRRWRPPDGSQ